MTQLTLSDISIMVQIIDTVAQRGAFKGDELLEVGKLRGKLMVIGAEMKKVETESSEKQNDIA